MKLQKSTAKGIRTQAFSIASPAFYCRAPVLRKGVNWQRGTTNDPRAPYLPEPCHTSVVNGVVASSSRATQATLSSRSDVSSGFGRRVELQFGQNL